MIMNAKLCGIAVATGLVVAGALVGCGVEVVEEGDDDDDDDGATPASVTAAKHAEACDQDDGGEPDDLAAQLARARAATERYVDVEAAIADGFIGDVECVSAPGLGAMGFHFVNPARLMDPLAIEEPEALLYIDDHGSLRLVAIEYLLPIVIAGVPYMGCGMNDQSCPPADPPPAPSLFTGVPFDGPMAGHSATMPWHYDQHVWLYEDNPSGLFAPYNPALSCEDECHDDAM